MAVTADAAAAKAGYNPQTAMCGRIIIIVKSKNLKVHYGVDNEISLTPRYNVSPSQQHPIVRNGESGRRELTTMRWGLVPFWAKDLKVGYKMINARAETLLEKPAYKMPFQARRCLVPASGFYEWQRMEKAKQPYLIRLKDEELMSFAGIWEKWQLKEQDAAVESFSIITTGANKLMAPIHDRMPVIVDPADYDSWLGGTTEEAHELLRPFDAKRMEAYAVSTLVNSPKNDVPECIERLPLPA